METDKENDEINILNVCNSKSCVERDTIGPIYVFTSRLTHTAHLVPVRLCTEMLLIGPLKLLLDRPGGGQKITKLVKKKIFFGNP